MKKIFLTLLLALVTNSCECSNTSNNETDKWGKDQFQISRENQDIFDNYYGPKQQYTGHRRSNRPVKPLCPSKQTTNGDCNTGCPGPDKGCQFNYCENNTCIYMSVE